MHVGHPALHDRYGAVVFLLLVVAPTQQPLRRIAEEVAKVTRQPQSRYVFLQTDHVHPTTVRTFGQGISQMACTTRKLLHGLVEQPVLAFAPVALWSADQTR